MTRLRSVTTTPFPPERQFVRHALRAGRRQAPVYGLVQLDVTQPVAALAAMDPPGSFTAYVLACVARAVAMHPEVAAYRDWRGRVVTHSHVDVAALVEVSGADGPFPLAHVVLDADVRSVAEISDELHRVKSEPGKGRSGALLGRAGRWVARVPWLVALFYWVMARSPRLRKMSGTVSVTSVGMFAGGSGLGLGPPTIMTANVLVGGISKRPWVVDDEIVVRDLVDLTISVDHCMVDGGPVARFCADLRNLIEGAGLMHEPAPETTASGR